MKRDVSRLGIGIAALIFCCFVFFLLGAASGRELLSAAVGPFPLGVWLLLAIHVLPVVFGVIHMNRADR